MKILVYSHSFSPRVGGVEVFSDRLARYLVAAGETVALVTETPIGSDAEPDLGYQVWRQPAFGTLRRLVADHEVVHSNGFALKLFVAGRLTRRPVLWFHHDYDTICPKSIAWNGVRSCSFDPVPCYNCLARDHSRSACWRRMASLLLKKMWVRLGAEHAAHNSYVLGRLGLAGGRVLPCAAEREKGTALGETAGEVGSPAAGAGGRPFALFAGRLIREKGCDVAIRALAECRRAGVDLALEICGDGPEMEALGRLAAELGVGEAVRFSGFVGGQELRRRMRAAACVLVPSLWEEPVGAVALEAMALERPVLASDVGGLGEMVRGFGIVVPGGDHRALGRRMAELVGSPELPASLRARCRLALAGGLDWSSTVRFYRAAYRELGGRR